jgi:hypothetical protein
MKETGALGRAFLCMTDHARRQHAYYCKEITDGERSHTLYPSFSRFSFGVLALEV